MEENMRVFSSVVQQGEERKEKQSKAKKSSQGTKQLKAPETVKQMLVCNFKTKQKETDINS